MGDHYKNRFYSGRGDCTSVPELGDPLHPKQLVGRIDFASGEQIEYTDSAEYLKVIREELPYRATSGFCFETMTNDPVVRKEIDDMVLDLYGKENPRRACNYGLTEAGKQALRDAADPSRPHVYAWFVITDINTPEKAMYQGLTLEQAIQIYRDSDCPEKRLGVTKDGIATVDLVHCQDGAQQFFADHEKLESFRADPAIARAVELLHLHLDSHDINLNMGGM